MIGVLNKEGDPSIDKRGKEPPIGDCNLELEAQDPSFRESTTFKNQNCVKIQSKQKRNHN